MSSNVESIGVRDFVNFIPEQEKQEVSSIGEIEIDSIEDQLSTRADRLSSKSEQDAYKAFIHKNADQIRGEILSLQKQGVSGEELSRAIKAAERSLQSSSTRFLKDCQSYQRVKSDLNSKQIKVSEDINSASSDFLSSPVSIGEYVGTGVGFAIGVSSEVIIGDYVTKKLEARHLDKINLAQQREVLAEKKCVELAEKLNKAKQNLSAARRESAHSKGKYVDLSKVKSSISKQEQHVKDLFSQIASAGEKLKRCQKVTAKLMKPVTEKVGGRIVTKLIAGGIGGYLGKHGGVIAGLAVEAWLNGEEETEPSEQPSGQLNQANAP